MKGTRLFAAFALKFARSESVTMSCTAARCTAARFDRASTCTIPASSSGAFDCDIRAFQKALDPTVSHLIRRRCVTRQGSKKSTQKKLPASLAFYEPKPRLKPQILNLKFQPPNEYLVKIALQT